MPITMMVNASEEGQPNVRVVRDYPGHEAGRCQHSLNCPWYRKDFVRHSECDNKCYDLSAIYLKTTYIGQVLSLRERNMYDDSDFFALVWDEETQSPREIEYASTRAWTYPNYAEVDATDEVKEKYAKWCRTAEEYQHRVAEEKEKHTVRVGKWVRIVKGRKYLGKEGVVKWQGANSFRTYYANGYNRPDALHNQRIKVEMDNGETFFTDYLNAEVVL